MLSDFGQTQGRGEGQQGSDVVGRTQFHPRPQGISEAAADVVASAPAAGEVSGIASAALQRKAAFFVALGAIALAGLAFGRWRRGAGLAETWEQIRDRWQGVRRRRA